MEIVRWSFHGLHMPMLAHPNGNLYCTSKMLQDALQLNADALAKLRQQHREDIQPLSPADDPSLKEFLTAHKEELGIDRVKEDMLLWSIADIFLAALLSRSAEAKELRNGIIQAAVRVASARTP